MQAEFTARMGAIEITTRCALCGWTVHGPFNETRQLSIEHRAAYHPELKPQRKRRGNRDRVPCIIDGCQAAGSATHGPARGLCRDHADLLRTGKTAA